GNRTLHVAPAPAGVLQAQIWRLIANDDAYADAPAGQRGAVLAEALTRALGQRDRWLEPDGELRAAPAELIGDEWIANLGRAPMAPANVTARGGGASLAVIDREGSAVACVFTMNAPFGTGRTIPGIGIQLALPPDAGSADLPMPMLVVNAHVNEVFFGAAASGGLAGVSALVELTARTLIGAEALSNAQTAPRIGGGEGGQVNAAHCSGGLPIKPDTCSVATDPRGFGLAVSADQ
ncbi:MAG: gamma-glutamyltransferase, partial [Alphaproteobacteria bacterium]